MTIIDTIEAGPTTAVAPVKHPSALAQIISQAPQLDTEKLRALLDMQREWEAGEAAKAYNAAFAHFKAEAVHIVRNKTITDGPLKGKKYPDLAAVVDAVTPALSKHGLSHKWATLKNEKDWIEVACVLTHVSGHSDRAEFGGPPDAGGAKNPIQARASTVSYLQRYTLLMVLGMAAGDQDNDGRGGERDERQDAPDPWTDALKLAASTAARDGARAYQTWWSKQSQAFRDAAVRTSQHADFKAAAQAA